MRRIAVLVVAFLLWCGLVWPYDQEAGWDGQSLLLGLGVAVLVAILFAGAITKAPGQFFNPLRIFWLIVYLPVLLCYCIRANLQVMYLVLHPDMPIKPGIVKVKTKLTTESGVTALANSITLTPGTLTVDVVNGNELYIHWIVVKDSDVDKATEQIVSRFEYFLTRIFG